MVTDTNGQHRFVVDDHVWRSSPRDPASVLYGRVVSAGTKVFVVEWQDGKRTRVRQGYGEVRIVPPGQVSFALAAMQGEDDDREDNAHKSR